MALKRKHDNIKAQENKKSVEENMAKVDMAIYSIMQLNEGPLMIYSRYPMFEADPFILEMVPKILEIGEIKSSIDLLKTNKMEILALFQNAFSGPKMGFSDSQQAQIKGILNKIDGIILNMNSYVLGNSPLRTKVTQLISPKLKPYKQKLIAYQ